MHNAFTSFFASFGHVTHTHNKRQVRLVFLCLLGCLSLLASGCATLPKEAASAKNGKPTYMVAFSRDVCSTATKYIGTPYRLGGNTPKSGFDCSGFVRWTYKQHGIDLPRTTKEQMVVGASVKKSQLQPGDIVAFKISQRRGYHTGIYLGEGEFIHSPSKGKSIRKDSMDSDYWRPRFITARRVASEKK